MKESSGSTVQQLKLNENKEESSKIKQTKNQEKRHILGLVSLSGEIEKRQNLRLFPVKVIQVIQNQKFSLPSACKEQQSQLWNMRFKLFIEANFVKLNFARSINPALLKSITSIKFPQLKQINLFRVGIESIQALGYVNMPCLQNLNLIYNLCHNFKPLAKMNTPSLKELNLYIRNKHLSTGNQVVQIGNLGRWSFNLTQLRLQKYSHHAIIISDLSGLSKMENIASKIFLSSVNRIINKRVLRTLKEKSFKYSTLKVEEQIQQYGPNSIILLSIEHEQIDKLVK